jgi:hypothetical protein
MIDKEFVPYELALALKQLGFDEPCFKYIYTGDTGNNVNIPCEVTPSSAKNYNEDDLSVSTPTFSQAFRWFRENYGLSGWVNESFVGSSQGVISIKSEIGLKYHTAVTKLFDTYEEAELACLKKLIEIVKTK